MGEGGNTAGDPGCGDAGNEDCDEYGEDGNALWPTAGELRPKPNPYPFPLAAPFVDPGVPGGSGEYIPFEDIGVPGVMNDPLTGVFAYDPYGEPFSTIQPVP